MSVGTQPTPAGHAAQAPLRAHWGLALVYGMALVILGMLAIGAAFIATLATIVAFGVLLLFGGAVHVITALSCRGQQLWLNLLGGVGGQSPVFYNLLMACAALLASRPRLDGHAWRRGMWAMLLIGLALQVKYSVVFEGIFIGLWLMFAEWKATRNLLSVFVYGCVLVAIALVPTALVVAWYAWIGAFDAFFFANFMAIFARKPNDLFTIFVSTTLVTFGLATFSGGLEGAGRAIPALHGLTQSLAIFGNFAIVSFFFVFPNGKFTPRWTAIILIAWILFQLPRYYLPGNKRRRNSGAGYGKLAGIIQVLYFFAFQAGFKKGGLQQRIG